jgi:hypothetical protein
VKPLLAATLPSGVPGIALPATTTERMIVIGTTRHDVKLDHLELGKRVQEVVKENLSTMRGGGDLRSPPDKTPAAPVELWTATVTPIRIPR